MNSTNFDHTFLRDAIGHYIRMHCIPVGHDVPNDSIELLIDLMAETVEQSATKFIAGQIEHGGKLTDRDCLVDALQEAMDLNIYIRTELRRRALLWPAPTERKRITIHNAPTQ